MTHPVIRWAGTAALTVLLAGAATAQMGPPRPGPRCLPGSYDGSQTEMATELELLADHRFRYGLSYGAIDESAEGNWETDEGGSVLLTSDPTTPPRFAFVEEAPASSGQLDIRLDLPTGISRQYFSAIVRFADNRSVVRQFADEGLAISLGPEDQPTSITLLLPVLSLESEAFKIVSNRGGEVYLRFEPNDLGKVAFAKTPLKVDRDDLLLERHDRLIRFRRSPEGCEVSTR